MSINFGILILQTMKVLIVYSKRANWVGKDGSLCVVAHRVQKSRNGWYLGMVAPTYFLHSRLLILYSKNVLGR